MEADAVNIGYSRRSRTLRRLHRGDRRNASWKRKKFLHLTPDSGDSLNLSRDADLCSGLLHFRKFADFPTNIAHFSPPISGIDQIRVEMPTYAQ
eukprot:gene19803-6946_t